MVKKLDVIHKVFLVLANIALTFGFVLSVFSYSSYASAISSYGTFYLLFLMVGICLYLGTKGVAKLIGLGLDLAGTFLGMVIAGSCNFYYFTSVILVGAVLVAVSFIVFGIEAIAMAASKDAGKAPEVTK